jgi:hypothetical protein
MEQVFVLVKGGDWEWEDIVIFLSKYEAIQASIKYPRYQIEVFEKKSDESGFEPTYNYYKNGEYYEE